MNSKQQSGASLDLTAAPMPSGVEHNNPSPIGAMNDALTAAPMPSGVEHRDADTYLERKAAD